jgi:hypothetical protein
MEATFRFAERTFEPSEFLLGWLLIAGRIIRASLSFARLKPENVP